MLGENLELTTFETRSPLTVQFRWGIVQFGEITFKTRGFAG